MNKQQHILVIRLSAMGDVAMLVHVVLALVEKYPELRLHILTQPLFACFFEDIPNVEIHEVEKRGKHKGLMGILRLARQIPNRIDVIADVHDVLRSQILRRVLSMRGLKNEKIDKGRSEKKDLTKLEHKVFKPLVSSHQRYADVFEKLGYQIELQPHHVKKQQIVSQQILEKLNLEIGQKYIGFAPFAAHRSKRMPIEKTQMLLQQLKEILPDYPILLFGGGKKEIEQLTAIASSFSNCINVAGKFSFKDELSLISNLKIMLSMDSGNGHLAAMFGVPVLSFWGGTHPYAGFAPFLQPKENQFVPNLKKYPLLPLSIYGNKMIDGYEETMNSIDYDAFFKRIQHLLN